MAYATRRSYAGAAPSCTLTNTISSGDTTISLTGDVTNWNLTASGPFYAVIDPGLATEEKILVATRSTTTLSSVTRGVDGTVAAGHSAGAICYPVFTAVDADQANAVASALSTKGDLLVTDGSVLNRLPVNATDGYTLLTSAAATNGVVWGQVANAGVATGAAIDKTKIAGTAVTLSDTGTVTNTMLAGSIADTKLSTIATALTVSNSATTATSANTASAIVARDASGNFTAGTITAALTGTASGNLVAGGALGTPSSGTLTNCTFPTLNQDTTGTAANATNAVNATNATNATYLNGFNKGNNTGTTNASGFLSIPHGLGSTPNVVLVANGDLGAYFGTVSYFSCDATNITVGAAANTPIRVMWIAYL